MLLFSTFGKKESNHFQNKKGEKMIVEQEYQVKLSEIGKDNKATNKAILSYLEDIGGIHSNMAGNGIFDIPTTHLTWVVLEWKLKIIRRPNYAEKIKVTTWSRNSIKCYAYRDFEIFDETGNVIVIAASKWVLVNTQKEKIVKIEEDLLSKYKPELDKKVFENEEFEKIKEPEKYSLEAEYQVRRADIDVNNHMHNLNYLDLVNEVLPEEVYKEKNFDNVRITYKKEIKFGDTVKCKYGSDGTKHIVAIKSEDEKTLHSIIEME